MIFFDLKEIEQWQQKAAVEAAAEEGEATTPQLLSLCALRLSDGLDRASWSRASQGQPKETHQDVFLDLGFRAEAELDG